MKAGIVSREGVAAAERFAVTGSEGCIGAWVVRHLVLAGYPVVALDLLPPGTRLHKVLEEQYWADVDHVSLDLRVEGAFEAVVREKGITRIIHLAALQVPLVTANPLLGSEVNVVGTVRVLEAARNLAGQVRGVSYASSTATMGAVDTPHIPESLYGAFKLVNEHTARIYARDYQTPSIGLRPCVVYGAARDQGLTAALTHAIKAAALRLPYEVPFEGAIDVQYGMDVAEAFVRAALVDDNTGAPVYDLHGDAVTVADFIAAIETAVPESRGLITAAAVPIVGKVIVDDSDLNERVGHLTKTSLTAGVHDSLNRFADHIRRGILTAEELPQAR